MKKLNCREEKLINSAFSREGSEIHFINPHRNADKTTFGINRMFLLRKHNICINLTPTSTYKETYIDVINKDWYDDAELIKKQVDEIMHLDVNSKSKYAKIEKVNKAYDASTGTQSFIGNCPKDCSLCCNDLFCISENEFLYMVAAIIRGNGFSKLYEVYTKAVRQNAFMKENYSGISRLVEADYEITDKEFYNIGYTVPMLEPCPLLDEGGKCCYYEARPAICRLYGTASKCEIAQNEPDYLESERLKNLLFENMVLDLENKKYIIQARPIYYFFVNYFAKENVFKTLKTVKEFISLPEDEFICKRKCEAYKEINI